MSVWESVEALFDFVYRTSHRTVMVKRRNWFERPAGASLVLWWIPAGSIPTPEQGLERLRLLDRNGPSQHAFDSATNSRRLVSPNRPSICNRSHIASDGLEVAVLDQASPALPSHRRSARVADPGAGDAKRVTQGQPVISQ